MPSLHEIEKTVASLWLNKEARKWLADGRKSTPPACLSGAPPEVLDTVDQNGVELYSRLMRYGHQDVMESIYPYCRRLLGGNWSNVVDDYLLRCPPFHYNFNRLCCRLSEYFTTYGGTLLTKYPFLAELADFEWIELEKLEQDVVITKLPHQELSDVTEIMTLRPSLNPTVTVRNYSFNIVEIAAHLDKNSRMRKFKPAQTFVAAFRHPDNQLCQFVELGATAAQVVNAAEKAASYQQLIPLVVTCDSDRQQAMLDFLELIEQLQNLGIFVGSQPASG